MRRAKIADFICGDAIIPAVNNIVRAEDETASQFDIKGIAMLLENARDEPMRAIVITLHRETGLGCRIDAPSAR